MRGSLPLHAPALCGAAAPGRIGQRLFAAMDRGRGRPRHINFYWYGIIRLTLRTSPSLTSVAVPNLRLRLCALDVNMWRRPECPRFTLPVAVFLKRLDAPLWVFNFGIVPRNQVAAGTRPHTFAVQLLIFNCSGIVGATCARPRPNPKPATPYSDLPLPPLPPPALLSSPAPT